MSDEMNFIEFKKEALFAIMEETEKLANVGGWEWDIGKDLWTFSDNWLRMHGCSSRHLKTADLLPIAHPDDRADIQKAFDKAVAEGTDYDIEHRIIRQDTGEERFIRALGRVKQDSNGKAEKLYGSAQDITADKHIEQQLIETELAFRKSSERLKLVLSAVNDPVWDWKIDTGEVYFSPQWYSVLGYEPYELPESYETWISLLHPDDLIFAEKTIKNHLKSGVPFSMEFRMRSKNGSWKWLLGRGQVVEKDNDGQPLRMLGTNVDISDRKKTETLMERVRYSIDKVSDTILWVNENGTFIDANEGACQNLGYDYDELMTKGVADIDPYFPKERWPSHWEEITQCGKMVIESVHQTKDGKRYPVEIILHNQKFLDRRYNCVFARDITDRKRSEEALRVSEEKFFKAFNLNPNTLAIIDLETKQRLAVNDYFSKLIGYSKKELMENPLGALGEIDMEKVEMAIKTIEQGESLKDIEVKLKHKNGNERLMLYCVDGIKVDNRNCMIVSGRDITEQKKAEKALYQSNETLKEAQSVAKIGSWWYDPVTQMPTWTDEMFHIFGIEPMPEALPYDEHRKIIHPDDWDRFDAAVSRAVTEGVGYNLELRVIRPSGEIRYINARCEAEKDKYGVVTRLIGTTQDITDQKLVEDALKISEERYDLAMSASQDGLYDWNLETNEIYFSPAWKNMLGYEDSELPNDFSVWEKLTEPKDVEKAWKMQNELINKKRDRFEMEFRMKHKDGHWVDILSRARATFNDKNEAVRIVGTHVDITDRKEAEEQLKRQRDLFGLVINSVPDRIFWKDLDLVYLGCNIHFAKDSGLERPEDVIGKDDYDLIWKEDADVYRADDRQVINTGKPKLQYEEPFISKEGEKIVWLTNKMPLKNPDGKIIGILAASENITERKQAEEDKRKLELQLHQAQKMESIGNLAGGIAHDFNNILSSIIGFTELALDETPQGTIAEDSLQEVYSAGKRAKDLVQQILAFARQSDEKRAPLQPVKIVKEVLSFVRSTIPTTIEIRQHLYSESWIMGNATHIHQVLMNLCTNAAHAMEESGGVLTVSMKDFSFNKEESPIDMEAGDYVEIRVTDTGYGIAPEIIDSVFEPYFTTKEVGEGTGMGLAMVQGVIESYDGKITVTSQLGKETIFTIYLPLTRKRSGHKAYLSEQLPTGTERILFVDDEQPIAKMGSRILENLGYSVTARTSSIEALELFQAKPNDFDLVLTDMTMPNMTGDKLAVELMKIRNDIPVILCTGYSKKISNDSAARIGIKAFTYKPIVKADLAKTVREVLNEAISETQD